MADGPAQILSLGYTKKSGVWEYSFALDNDEWVVATGSTKEDAAAALREKAAALGLLSDLEQHLSNLDLGDQCWPADFGQMPAFFKAPFSHGYQLDEESGEHIAYTILPTDEQIEARGDGLRAAQVHLLERLRERGVDVDNEPGLESLRVSVASYKRACERHPGGQPLSAPYDFNLAFEEGRRIPAAKTPLRGEATVHVVTAGILHVPSGRIVVRDPGMCPSQEVEETPLAEPVPPGSYRVELSFLENSPERRITAARLIFMERPAVRWEQALTMGQDVSKLKPGEMFGFGVDAGMAMFADIEAAMRLTADERARTHWMETRPLYGSIRNQCLERKYADVVVDATKGLNVIAFDSGWGDGDYPCFWGLDETGSPVSLVIDFEVVPPDCWKPLLPC